MNNMAEIDELLQGVVDRNEIPGVVAAVTGRDRILYKGAFGNMDTANNVEMSADAIFEIISLTKPFTSVAVMMLLEEGRLDLDQPVSDFLPSLRKPEVITRFDEAAVTYETKPAEGEITIRHLLTHTAGFGYMFFSRIVNLLMKKTGKNATDLPLLFEPGTRWMYGPNTRVLGRMVEEITGMTLEEYFRARISGPLGLDDTCYLLPEERYNRLVTTHRRKDGKLIEDPGRAEPETNMLGDTGLYSTSGDYVRFLQMFLNDGALDNTRILSKESIGMMVCNQIGELVVEIMPGIIPDMTRSFPIGGGRDKFGLGFQITAGNGESSHLRSPGSCGWAGMKNTFFWFDPQKEIAAVIMIQVMPFYDETCVKVLGDFEEEVYKGLN